LATLSEEQEVPRPEPPVNRNYHILCHSVEEREKWLEMRKAGIGASDCSTILGKNPYESAYSLYCRRTGALPEHIPDNDNMSWGRRLEAVIGEAFADETGRSVTPDGWLYQSRLYPWMLATPDCAQSKDVTTSLEPTWGILEIKTANAEFLRDWEEEPPVGYQLQLQHQLIVLGKTWGSLACLIGGSRFRWKDREAHPKMQSVIIRKTEHFWKQLRGELPAPEPDAHPASSRALMQLIENGQAVQLPDVAVYWHEQALKHAADEKAARELKEEYRCLLRAAIGRASYGIMPNDKGMYTFETVHTPEKVVAWHSERHLTYSKKVRVI
jgi:putative phage-type endonuclease